MPTERWSTLVAPILQIRLVTISDVAIAAGVGKYIGCIQDFVLIFGLRRLIGLHGCVAETLHEDGPVCIIGWHRSAIGANPSRNGEQAGRFCDYQRCILDSLPLAVGALERVDGR